MVIMEISGINLLVKRFFKGEGNSLIFGKQIPVKMSYGINFPGTALYLGLKSSTSQMAWMETKQRVLEKSTDDSRTLVRTRS